MHYFHVHDYNKYQKQILEKFGNKKIKKIYLVREPVKGLLLTLINIITRYNFNHQIKEYKEKFKKNLFFPLHTSIICEIESEKKRKKMILIEKTNYFKINTTFKISDYQEILQLKIKKKWTLSKLLDQTQERMGKKQFFNWHICKNNCQVFIKEILKTLKIYTSQNKIFLMQDEFAKYVSFTNFETHAMNCIINTYNILDMFFVSIF
jgi:hypothetical protein